MTNVSVLIKSHTQHKVRVVNSIVTIVFCDSQRLSNLTPVNIGTGSRMQVGTCFRARDANLKTKTKPVTRILKPDTVIQSRP